MREYFDTNSGGEQFWLSGSGGTVNIEFDNWYKTFTGVSEVVIDMGEGDDMLDASLLTSVTLNAHGGAGNDTIIVGSGGGTIYGDAGDDLLIVASGSTATTLDGGSGDDELTGGAGNDTLIGGDGSDKLYGNAGNDSFDGGAGSDILQGGMDDDTYKFAAGYGIDRFSDNEGETYLDFSATAQTHEYTLSRNGVSVAASNGDELRTGLAEVRSISLGSGDDQVYVKGFPDGTVNIVDTGGDEDYRVTLDRAQSTLADGTVAIIDNSGSFDELIVSQTISATAVNINSQAVNNGRENITYNTGIERLTLAGKEALYSSDSIQAFGGDVTFTTSQDTSDLGAISFRVIGKSVEYEHDVIAGNIIIDSLESLEIDHNLTAINNGYVDLRTYGDTTDLTLSADIKVSAGDTTNGDGNGWVRMVSADGSILNSNGARIIAAGSILQMRAKDCIGSVAAPILTTVADLTAITSNAGSGDIVIRETDSFNIEAQNTKTDTENPGFIVTPGNGEDWWEENTTWDNNASSDWLNVIQTGRTDYGVEAGNGNIDITLLAQDALLTLESGDIHALKSAANITLTTDDLDFKSGEAQIIASGDLIIQANQLDWDYLLGTSAEVFAGDDERIRGDHLTSMAMGMRDFAALADGFNSVTIGRRNAGNTMWFGDLYNATTIKLTQDPVMPRSDNAILKDHTYFLSDDLQIKGDVRASANNTLEFAAKTISINSQNWHNPLGDPDSGVYADIVKITADDQLHVGGWIKADTLVDIDVTASTGVNPTGTGQYVTPPNATTSIFMDVGSKIESLNAASQVLIDASHAVQVGSFIEVHGAGSFMDINVGTDFLLNEAAVLAARDANALIDVNAGGLMAINAGSAISSGIRFEKLITAQNIPTNADGTLNGDVTLNIEINKEEFVISASVTITQASAAGNTTLDDLALDIQAAMEAATWRVSDVGRSAYAQDAVYSDFVANSDLVAGVSTDSVTEGQLTFTGLFNTTIKDTSTNGNFLGLDLDDGGTPRNGDLASAGTPTPVLTGAGADIVLSATGEMLIAGAVGTSDRLDLSSGSATRDDENFGDPNHDTYLAQYAIYNKTAYFNLIKGVSPDHYLVDHAGQYGLLISGTIVSLGDNTDLELSSDDDLLIRGNISATGTGSTLAIQSDVWTFVEGNILADSGITIAGGMELDATDLDGADAHDTSVYVHATSTIRTSAADADISVMGSHDVDLHGVLVAGGSIGQNGVIWSGAGSDLAVSAGSQLLVDTGLLAAGNVAVNGGTPGVGDNALGMLFTTAGGATARGYQGVGGNITSNSTGDMQMMGTWVAGGSLFQTFDNDGNLLTQSVDWSGTAGTVTIANTGQTWIGGDTVNSEGDPIETGGYIHSAGNITIGGGGSSDGIGVKIHGASEIAVKQADGTIHVDATQDAEIEGLLAAGGVIHQVRDAQGTYQGRYIETFDGASRILIEADDQIRIGVGLQAGQSIDLVGGDDPSGTSIILYGSAMLETWMDNSFINLNGLGRVDILAPGHTNEVLAQVWPMNAAGILDADVTLDIRIDKVSYDIEASITIAAVDTVDNSSVSDLMADIPAALESGSWTITRSDVPEFIVGNTYDHFADDPDTAGQVDPDLKMKLREGHLNFTGPYSFQVLDTSLNADKLGVDLTSGALESGLYYAIDARETGSVVNLGAPAGPNGKVYVAGKVIANSAINMYSGTDVGDEIELDLTGVLETVNGSIQFDAGLNGVIKGDIIAGGVGSDIILNSDGSLTIRGSLDACHDVILTGGTVEDANALSLKIENTASIISTGGGGTLQLGGANEVIIDGVVGTGSTTLAGVEITSTFGTVTVTKASGWITADAPLTLSGANVDIAGVVESTATDGADIEVLFDATDTLTVQGDVEVAGDLKLHAGTFVDIYNAGIKVTGAGSTLEIFSDGNIETSNIGLSSGHDILDDGQLYQQGATIEGVGSVHFNAAGNLIIGSAILVGTTADNSNILLEADTATVIGSVLAGASVSGGSAVWQANEATLDVNIVNQLVLGGNAYSIDGATTTWEAQGGNLKSTGDLTISISGGSNAVSLSQNSLSSIVADSTAGGDLAADGTSSQLQISTDHGINIYGFLQANEANSTVTITTEDTAFIDGIVEAGNSISLTAGDDDSGTSVLLNPHVYERGGTANAYFVDENGRLMDGTGFLVDADGNYVDEAGEAVAEGDKVRGGDPVRVSGATFNTLGNGTVTIVGAENIYLNGQVGRPTVVGDTVSVNISDITIESTTGTISTSGLVNATDSITMIAGQIDVMSGGVVKTRGSGSELRMAASGNIFVSGDTGNGEAQVSAVALTHFSGNNLRLDGLVEAQGDNTSRLLLNGATSIVMGGNMVSTGKADLRGGVDLSWNDTRLTASTMDVASLGNALVHVISDGGIFADGNIDIRTGGDFTIETESVLQDDQLALLTPIITSEAVTIQVVTGYTQVEDGFILIPQVSWVTTTVSEQIGTEEVKAGISYHTMDITLTQDAYYNGTTLREWFVEGVDYHNSSINWASTGAVAPGSGYQPFNTLNDLQKLAVITSLGYKPLYDFSYANPTLHQVINGNPTQQDWSPDWASNADEIVNLAVAGWEDKYIRMPVGATADVLRVVSQGEATVWNETVGRYKDEADVRYTQQNSDYGTQTQTFYEPWGSVVYTTRTVADAGDYNEYFRITYNAGTGDRFYEVYDGRTGGNTVSHDFDPLWVTDSNFNNYNPNVTTTGSRYVTASTSYYDTTDSVSYINQQASWSVNTGYIEYGSYSYDDRDFWSAATADSPDTGENGAPNQWIDHYYFHHSSSDHLATFGSQAELNYAVDQTSHGDGWYWVGLLRGGGYGQSLGLPAGADNWNWLGSGGTLSGMTSFSTSNSMWNSGEPSGDGAVGMVWKDSAAHNKQLNDLNGGTQSIGLFEAEPRIYDGTVQYDTFYSYNYDWQSTWNTISDTRKTLQYQFTTNTTDIYETRPKYATYDVQTKVVENQQITIWRNEPVVTDQIINRTSRVYDTSNVDYGAFENNALQAGGNITIIAGDDTSISGLVSGTGVDSQVSVTAGGDITVNGVVPDGAPDGTVAARATVVTTGNINFDATGTVTIGNAGAMTSSDAIALTGITGAVINGDLISSSDVTIISSGDVGLGSKITTTDSITVTAGNTDNIGSITGNLAADLVVSDASGTIALTAGSSDGDILLTDSSLTTDSSITLTALAGEIDHSGGLITTATLSGSSRDGFMANVEVNTLGVANSGVGGIDVANDGALLISSLETVSGAINLVNFGAVSATTLRTSGTGNDDDIDIQIYGGGLTYNTIAVATGGLGDISLHLQGSLINSGGGQL